MQNGASNTTLLADLKCSQVGFTVGIPPGAADMCRKDMLWPLYREMRRAFHPVADGQPVTFPGAAGLALGLGLQRMSQRKLKCTSSGRVFVQFWQCHDGGELRRQVQLSWVHYRASDRNARLPVPALMFCDSYTIRPAL